ncbi:uroporphyrinogen-III C-methyltransferase [Pseudohongiella nitratireducens]|uniref:uroporphyrinogen-III C-methyltransferase n=1 Tax=Pseudohongiella nitratireducens TaxID=1768907 RepID=UPI0030EED636|tara:strand:+ start:20886 stop:21683 length:798 start_codon:yes stop_codon:yes gene_type:complete
MLTLAEHKPGLPGGEVWLVGAGPGDPDLISVRGLKLIRQADVLVYDRLVAPELIDEARVDAIRIYVGKQPGHHPVPQEKIESILVEQARLGRSVVRVKGGDPSVFGRVGEEMMRLEDVGIPVHIVPGITAASACAAAAGFPLTQRGVADNVCLSTAHHSEGAEDSHWASLAADKNRTLVFYMGLSSLTEIRTQLVKHGLAASTPAALIENGSMKNQRVVHCALIDIDRTAKTKQLKTPCLLVVGEVTAMAAENRQKLNTRQSTAA